MKILIRTKDIARVRLTETRASDTFCVMIQLCIAYYDGTNSEWSMKFSDVHKYMQNQMKTAYEEATKAIKEERPFVELEID